ncbi:MAG: TonB-dependent receptor [Candidatus Marinimicrobia bacterium]|nr:TonB-dependent receptor [Candidatus Neomarinimicrobiota bacterium]MCH8068841.1 TonB-dependent receptor [Candidatus Neomarinimicrobiota bacterium]
MKTRFILLFVSMIGNLIGQGTVQGVVQDVETNHPIISANVLLQYTDLGSATDKDGHYLIKDVPMGDYIIVYSAIGYETIEREITVVLGVITENVEMRQTPIQFPMVTVVQKRTNLIGSTENLYNIPGSVHLITHRELDRYSYGDIHRILRKVPGINIQEEDGFGLRPNIGMRGTGVERSRKISLMEDGILIAPAPYAAPSAYYFPTVGRMESIEVRKGSSQIKYGPNTNGGALNMISTSVPSELTVRGTIIAGAYNSFRTHVHVGDSRKHFGWLLETYLHKTDGFKILDNGGNTGFDKKDYIAKFRVNTSTDVRIYQSLELKIGMTDEISNETYLGLTDTDFSVNPYRRYLASQKDQMDAEHSQVQLRHFIRPARKLDITTTFYRNDFHRNWYKLDKVGGEKIASILSDPFEKSTSFKLLTSENSDADEYQIKANNRTYFSQGVQTIINFSALFAGAEHEIQFSIRYHEDEEDRFQHVDKYQMVNGKLVLTTKAEPGSKDNRIGSASGTSLFLQDKTSYAGLTITAGVRQENIQLVRTDYGKGDPDRIQDPELYKTDIIVLIPGIGIDYKLTDEVSLFSGVHKGFSPPGPGKEGNEVKAEESINAEVGLRLKKNIFKMYGVVFFNQYENMLGADLRAIGGEGTGDQFNAGEVDVYGLELTANYSKWIGSILVPIYFSYTFTNSEFKNEFESKFGPWGTVSIGDKIPYIPEQQFFTSIGVEAKKWSSNLSIKYTDAMRTTAGQGEMEPFESTDPYLVFDFVSEYKINNFSRIFVSVQNLTDETYIVARRPAGVRPGLPRTITAGIKLKI